MAIYKVWVRLENEFDDIEANSPEEAFIIASEAAINGSSWEFYTEKLED